MEPEDLNDIKAIIREELTQLLATHEAMDLYRPLDDIIRQAVEMAREESPWLSTQPAYTIEEIQAVSRHIVNTMLAAALHKSQYK